MEKIINKFLYLKDLYYKDKFQEINNLDSVHPEDQDFVKNNITNTIYECIEVQGEYLVIKAKKYTLRIKPNVIRLILPTSNYKWNEKVFENSKPTLEARIEDILWHHKEQKYYYHISINGKRKSRRYSESDFI